MQSQDAQHYTPHSLQHLNKQYATTHVTLQDTVLMLQLEGEEGAGLHVCVQTVGQTCNDLAGKFLTQ